MRIRIVFLLAFVLLLAVAAPASANELPEPFDVSGGIEVGRAAETNSLNGIYVSPATGNVYVASVGGDEITVHDPDSGALLDRIGPERGVGGPDDVFITEDGTIYWTEILTGFVGMLKPDGTFVRQQVGPGVNPITIVRRREAPLRRSVVPGSRPVRARPEPGRRSCGDQSGPDGQLLRFRP